VRSANIESTQNIYNTCFTHLAPTIQNLGKEQTLKGEKEGDKNEKNNYVATNAPRTKRNNNKLRSRHDAAQHGCNLGGLIIIPQLDKPEIR
jgi:hypothetical protein